MIESQVVEASYYSGFSGSKLFPRSEHWRTIVSSRAEEFGELYIYLEFSILEDTHIQVLTRPLAILRREWNRHLFRE